MSDPSVPRFGGTAAGRPPRWRGPGVAAVALLLGLGLIAPDAAAQVWQDYDFRALEFRGIGVAAGVVWPASVERAVDYTLRLDLGMVGPRVRIHPSARFWASRMKEREVRALARQIVLVCERQPEPTCPAELDLGEVRLSDLELSVDAHYLLLQRAGFAPYLGAGLGLHLLNGRGDFIAGTFVEELLDSVAPGLGPLLGVNLQLAPAFRIAAEARFMLASEVRYAGLNFGGVWALPTPGRPDADVRQRMGR